MVVYIVRREQLTVQEYIAAILSSTGEDVLKHWDSALEEHPTEATKILEAVSDHLVDQTMHLF